MIKNVDIYAIFDTMKYEFKRNILDAHFYNTFIKPLQIQAHDESNIYLKAANAFAKGVVEQQYINKIKNDFDNYLGHPVNVFVILKGDKMNIATNKVENNFSIVNGEYNKDVINAIDKFLNGENNWNPLIIIGDTGCGKTHALEYAQNKYKLKNSNVHFIDANTFAKKMYLTFQQGTNEVENIKNIYSDAGLLIIDNINLLANKEKIKEIFFEIIHHVIQNNGKILASTSIDIAKTKFSERESGILLRGLQISIKQPTKEDIKKILLFNINREKINLSFTDEALDFIISRNKNINHLQGLVHKVLFYASNNNIKENIITSSDVKKALEIENNDEINAFGFDVDPVLIIKNICQAYNIAYEKIISKDKSKKYNSIRAICMYVLKNKYPNMTYNQVASYFSGRSHSTVFAAINKIDATIKNDETLKNFLKKYIKI